MSSNVTNHLWWTDIPCPTLTMNKYWLKRWAVLCYYFSDAEEQKQSAFAGGDALVADVTEYVKQQHERGREGSYINNDQERNRCCQTSLHLWSKPAKATLQFLFKYELTGKVIISHLQNINQTSRPQTPQHTVWFHCKLLKDTVTFCMIKY